jgi:hypothetical protein
MINWSLILLFGIYLRCSSMSIYEMLRFCLSSAAPSPAALLCGLIFQNYTFYFFSRKTLLSRIVTYRM